MRNRAAFSIKKMLQYQYVKQQQIDTNTSLFWSPVSKSHTVSLQRSCYFLFHSKKIDEHVVSEVYQGTYSFRLYHTIPNQVFADTKLVIHSTYYETKELVHFIWEITTIPTVHVLELLLKHFARDTRINFKIIFDVQNKQRVLQKMEQHFKYYTVLKKEYSKVTNLYYHNKQEYLQQTLEYLQNTEDVLLELRLFIQVTANMLSELITLRKDLQRLLTSYGATSSRYQFEQKKGIAIFYFQATSLPSNDKKIFLFQKEAMKVLPIGQASLVDPEGKRIGRDIYDNGVYLNIWHTDNQRTNHNFVILGQSGQGKTTLLQKIISQTTDEKIIIVDPENEYQIEVQQQVSYHKYSLRSQQRLFEFEHHIFDDEHIHTWSHHFRVVMECSIESELFLQQLLVDFKEKQHAHTRSLASFLMYVETTTVENASKQLILAYVRMQMQRIFCALDHTSQITHYTIDQLIDTKHQHQKMLLYEVLVAIWHSIKKQRDKTMVIIDEGYFLFDETNDIVVELLRNMFKRARKHNVAIGIATQNLLDFQHPKLKHLLGAILDNCSYKFVFKQGEQDHRNFQQYYHFTQQQQDEFSQLERGACMLVIGEQYGKIKVERNNDDSLEAINDQ